MQGRFGGPRDATARANLSALTGAHAVRCALLAGEEGGLA